MVNKCLIVLLPVLLLLGGCDNGYFEDDPRSLLSLSGVSQKGPFLAESIVKASQLDHRGQVTAVGYETQTVDNLGRFHFDAMKAGVYEIQVEGYYFNELTGNVSGDKIILRGIFKVDKGTAAAPISVNMLTHLIRDRVVGLMADGKSFQQAQRQAERELINAFTQVATIHFLPDFRTITILHTSDQESMASSYLLTISANLLQWASEKAILLNTSTDSQLQQIMNEFSVQFAERGTVEDSGLLRALRQSQRYLQPAQISAHLEARSRSASNETWHIPDISVFIDSDLDGQTNQIDNDDDNDGTDDAADPTPLFNIDTVEKPRMVFSSEPPYNKTTQIKVAFPAAALTDGHIQYRINGEPLFITANPGFEVDWLPYLWSYQDEVTFKVIFTDVYGRRIESDGVVVPIAPDANAYVVTSPPDGAQREAGESIVLHWRALHENRYAQWEVWPVENHFARVEAGYVDNQLQAQPNTVTLDLAPGYYQWRVRMTDHPDQWPKWSAAQSLEVKQPASGSRAPPSPVPVVSGWIHALPDNALTFSAAYAYVNGRPWRQYELHPVSAYRVTSDRLGVLYEGDGPVIRFDITGLSTYETLALEVFDGEAWSKPRRMGVHIDHRTPPLGDIGVLDAVMVDGYIGTAPFYPGDFVELQYELFNSGTEAVYIPKTKIILVEKKFHMDTILAEYAYTENIPIPGLGSFAYMTSLELPADLAPGTYYVGVVLDPDNAIVEPDDEFFPYNNNVTFSPELHVLAAP